MSVSLCLGWSMTLRAQPVWTGSPVTAYHLPIPTPSPAPGTPDKVYGDGMDGMASDLAMRVGEGTPEISPRKFWRVEVLDG